MGQFALRAIWKPAAGFATRILSAVAKMNGESNLELRQVRSILCVELSHLGDVVAILPVLEHFKKTLPNASVTVAIDREYASMFRFVPYVDNMIGLSDTSGILGLMKSLRLIRKNSYDLVCSMSPSSRNALLAASMVHAKGRVGYFVTSDSVTPFLTRTKLTNYGIASSTRAVYEGENLYERPKKIEKLLGIANSTISPRFHIPLESQTEYENKLRQRGLLLDSPYIVFHPFAGWKYRRWPSAFAMRFMEKFARDKKKLILIGNADEAHDGNLMYDELKNSENVAHAFGLPLDELIVLLSRAALFVGTDSGPLHLAAAVGIPVVGLYGPAHPQYTAPEQRNHSFFFKQVECSPCDQRNCVRPTHSCMHLISVEEVLEEVEKRLHAR